ncbi:lactonase family protein [Algoriphagus pacificus]|uniref:Lactonase family protein n=1 Tax=Algoriphagus pacificus TaxID=2811234 RepID=A0ABS3CN04_9BACT|nr:lactonase family protein [Algoriphagus pacificus]MBN7817630.1 lactonase family protein [Algoriphagus pacificus]
MKQLLYLSLVTLFVAACSNPSAIQMPQETQTYSFLVGTYTDTVDQGINFLKFNPEENLFEVQLLAPDVQNPSYVIASKNSKLVFALEESAGVSGGDVLSFNLNLAKDSLELIAKQSSYGNHPCYLALSPDESLLTVGNYSGGNLSIYSVQEDGNFTYLQTVQHEGKSVNEARQEGPHVHSTVFNPKGDRLLVADLGTDKIYNYKVSGNEAEPLSLLAEFPVTPGDGPRHMKFSEDGESVFVVQEMSATLEIYSFMEDKLELKQRLSLLDEGFTGQVGAAEVRLSSDGKNVYVSNRGEANTISVFSKNESGEFERIQNISSGGVMPRNFIVTKDGKYLLAAHQSSNDIVVFERNPETGELTITDWKVTLNKPVYLFQLTD